MCEWGTSKNVRVKLPADLSGTGKQKWKDVPIDACIADLVKALQEGGIDMRGSCCGHGKDIGDIHLQDGRILLIADSGKWFNQRGRYLLQLWWRWVVWYARWWIRYNKAKLQEVRL